MGAVEEEAMVVAAVVAVAVAVGRACVFLIRSCKAAFSAAILAASSSLRFRDFSAAIALAAPAASSPMSSSVLA